MDYFGRVFRPPSEAQSLIIQATVGCSHNQCTFCDMYKEKKFFIRPVKDTIKDLEELSQYYPNVNRIFLGDGDALIMKTEDLLEILKAIHRLFPKCHRITCYATPKSILVKTEAELKKLRENGLTMVYLGLESGDDKVLKKVNKGATSKDMIKAAQMIKKAGIKLSVTAVSGLGGVEDWVNHAINTGKTISKMNPDYLGLLTLRAEGQAPLVKDIEEGRFIMLTPEQVAAETRLMLENIDSPGTVFRSNHISNYINLAGTLNEDTPRLLKELDDALEGKTPFKDEELRHWDLKYFS